MTNKQLVLEMISKYSALRDNDNKLTANIWNKQIQLKNLDINTLTASDILRMFANGELAHPTSIRRDRAKFQEVNVHLRGVRYKERQTKAQESYKQKMLQKGLYKEKNYNFEQE